MTGTAIDGVVFDAFGTVLRITQRTNAYGQLLREGRRQGLQLAPDSIRMAMTTNHSFDEIASQLGVVLTRAKRLELSTGLKRELASIQAFPDAKAAITLLQQAGVKVGICSNLAASYGPVVREIFPHLDGYAFSFELGVMKPEPAIYHAICNQIGVEPGHGFGSERGRVLMIGDSPSCDRDGPRAVGIMGVLLCRTGAGTIRDLIQFAQLVIDQSKEGLVQLGGQAR
ncbi:HAD family hydrolase [Pseudomonas graminis]|uniref:HAD family hydrolase n=1 Tax=Pseudomonas graminis TaxID=158627 RepID=UPI00234AC8AE|nr:HAD family hydrolase [Pseudomonas graminis]MDC6378870.1 HAD family hydrolase [Pseudomonas graminis]